MKQLISIIIFIMLLTTIVLATEPIWTFNKCLQYAFENNLDIKRQQNIVTSSEYDLTNQKWAISPYVSASSRANLDLRRSTNQNNDISSGSSYNINMNLNGSLPLFNGLRNFHWIKARKYLVDANTQALNNQKFTLYSDILKSYVGIIFHHELVKIYNDKLSESQLQLEKVKLLIEVGKKEKVAINELQATVANQKLNVLKTKNQLELMILNLKQILEIPHDTEFNVDTTSFLLTNPYDSDQTIPQIYTIAQNHYPRLKEQELLLNYFDRVISIQKSYNSPSLTLTGGYGTRFYSTDTLSTGQPTPFSTQFSDYLNPYLGVSLNIPIFNRRNREFNVKKARLNRQNQLYTLKKEKKQVLADIEWLTNQLSATYAEYESALSTLKFTQTSYRSYKEKYDIGIIQLTDFVSAQNQLSTAKAAVIEAKLNWIITNKAIDIYLGKINE